MKSRFFAVILLLIATSTAFAAKAPKYIFYFIGDGMGMAHAMGAQIYNRTVLNQATPLTMMQFPVTSQCSTHSASSPVTDSAAAGTALATGSKTNNGMLGMNADTVAVTSIATELQAKGYGIAILTDVQPDDATPGAFYAHVPRRSMFYEIGVQAAESGFDFLAGSELRGLKNHQTGEPTDLLNVLKTNGVDVIYGLDNIANSKSKRILLLEKKEALQRGAKIYTTDSISPRMSLADMTEAALNHLKKNGHKKFFMMVEGGHIDHVAHSNDGASVIRDVLKFDKALRHAYNFYLQHPDETLIVVTADHETGGMSLGNNSVGYDLHLKYLDYQKVSKDDFAHFCRTLRKDGATTEWSFMKQFLTDNLGFWDKIPLSEKQTAALETEFHRCFSGETPPDRQTLYNSFNSFTDMVYSVVDSVTGLGFSSSCHTAGLVPVFAIGVGAEQFARFNDNTTLPATIRQITK